MSTKDNSLRGASVYKIIVGVDYGTTYSGVSYVVSSKSDIKDINVISLWPGANSYTEWKTPTKIAYAYENNQKLTEDAWGFQVSPNMKSYTWTKLLLDKNVDLTQHDDPLLRDLYGSGLMQLPSGKSAQDVCKDFLRELYNYTIKKLEREMTPEVVRMTPIECWVTMPATWSDKAQAATRDAAAGAGFGSRSFDALNMIAEPEAAALAAMKPHLGLTALDAIKPGESLLVCDCGGGTVDIATYKITQVEPTLKFDEICIGMGGKCGSTAIDRNFNQWMIRKFGEAYTSLPMTKRGPGSTFMNAFESRKRNFGGSGLSDRAIEIGPLIMDTPYSPFYDDEEMNVRLSKSDMESLFQPVVNDLISLVESQANLVKQKTGRTSIDRLILVGGFGDSEYLNDRLKEWCKKNWIKRFTCPPDCQAAIVKGAALRGLEGLKPTTTIAKRHYGWRWCLPFRAGIDDEKKAYYDKFDGQKMCRNRMEWFVQKHQAMDPTYLSSIPVTQTVVSGDLHTSKLELYYCTQEAAPQWTGEASDAHTTMKIGEVVTDFDASNSDCRAIKWNAKVGKNVYRYSYNVEIAFRATAGTLQFKSKAGGVERGKTSLRFDRE